MTSWPEEAMTPASVIAVLPPRRGRSLGPLERLHFRGHARHQHRAVRDLYSAPGVRIGDERFVIEMPSAWIPPMRPAGGVVMGGPVGTRWLGRSRSRCSAPASATSPLQAWVCPR